MPNWEKGVCTRHAYEQIELHPSSRKFVTINTPRGLFSHKRLPYVVSSAPWIFQRVMDSLLKGIPNTMVYLDDILVTGPTEEEHLQTLELVFERLPQAGFRLKASTCSFLSEEVEYLGHRIDAEGIHSSGTTLSAIRESLAPTKLTELRSCRSHTPQLPSESQFLSSYAPRQQDFLCHLSAYHMIVK